MSTADRGIQIQSGLSFIHFLGAVPLVSFYGLSVLKVAVSGLFILIDQWGNDMIPRGCWLVLEHVLVLTV